MAAKKREMTKMRWTTIGESSIQSSTRRRYFRFTGHYWRNGAEPAHGSDRRAANLMRTLSSIQQIEGRYQCTTQIARSARGLFGSSHEQSLALEPVIHCGDELAIAVPNQRRALLVGAE